MPATIQRTDPASHPRFVREQRWITAILTQMLVRRGWPEHEALREAESVLAPLPAQGERSKHQPYSGRAAGA